MKINDRITIKGQVEVKVFGPDGKLKQHEIGPNGITNDGLEKIVDGLVSGGMTAHNKMGIGFGVGANTAFAVGQTDLQGATKNKTPTSISTTKIDGKNWKITALWDVNNPSPSATVGIEEIGTFWGTAISGEMFSRTVRAIINKAPIDSLEITYTFTIA